MAFIIGLATDKEVQKLLKAGFNSRDIQSLSSADVNKMLAGGNTNGDKAIQEYMDSTDDSQFVAVFVDADILDLVDTSGR